MAILQLGPREQFEHYHAGPSATILREGEATLSVDTRKAEHLRIGIPVQVPPGVSHTITNPGDATIAVECVYGPPDLDIEE